MYEFQERLKVDGLEGQLVEDFGKCWQTVSIKTGLSDGVHACFRETPDKWQSPVHTERHYLKKWKEVPSSR